eukprot:COSAG02_NODE_2886_length_7814_cov_3.379123_3_plen_58_part_00
MNPVVFILSRINASNFENLVDETTRIVYNYYYSTVHATKLVLIRPMAQLLNPMAQRR